MVLSRAALAAAVFSDKVMAVPAKALTEKGTESISIATNCGCNWHPLPPITLIASRASQCC